MGGKKESDEINILDALKKLKKNYVIILVLCFIIFGFYLRFYHIQYPVIGYHNWKTAHYVTEARNFDRDGFFKYGFFIPAHNTLETINEPPDGDHGDAFPFMGIVTGIFFRLFGDSIIIARMVGIVLSLLSVVLVYL